MRITLQLEDRLGLVGNLLYVCLGMHIIKFPESETKVTLLTSPILKALSLAHIVRV